MTNRIWKMFFISVQFARMAFAVKEDVSLDPVAIGLFSAETEMPEASHVGDLIEQLFLGHIDA